MTSQGIKVPSKYTPKKDKQSSQGGTTQSQDALMYRPQPQVRMGKYGPEIYYPSPKDQIFQNIQNEKQQRPLSEDEQKFEDKYLGIDRKKKDAKNLTSIDMERIWKVHKDMMEQDGVYEVTPEVRQEYLQKARKFLFPNMDDSGTSNLDAEISEKVEGKVMIETPDGKRWYIPKNNLNEAIRRGAKAVN